MNLTPPPHHRPSLLAQPFLGGQAVLPQSHAGATIASPQLQPFHCVMNTSRNKPKNRPVGPAEPPHPPTLSHPSTTTTPHSDGSDSRPAGVCLCPPDGGALTWSEDVVRRRCGRVSTLEAVSQRGDRRPPSAHTHTPGPVRSGPGGREGAMTPEE